MLGFENSFGCNSQLLTAILLVITNISDYNSPDLVLVLGDNVMGDIVLFKSEGKASEKLLDVINKAIGKIYAPRAIRNEADARAYEISTIERAKTEAIINRQEMEQDMLDRIEGRILHRELRKQMNIDNVARIAIEQLKNESNVSDDPVDEDWTIRFFNIVEDVSDEQMQLLWGKILAGEVKTPNSFSIRTIELLKNITKSEAKLFTRIANYIITNENKYFIFKGDNSDMLNNYGFTFEDRLKLIEIGLIQPETNLVFKFMTYIKDVEDIFISGKYLIKSTKKANSPQCEIPALRLTSIGEELIKLLTITSVDNYIKDFSLYMQSKGLNIEYAFILEINKNELKHTQPWMKF